MRPVPSTRGTLWAVPESTTGRTDWPASPAPPWTAQVRATIWWHRATADAATFGPGGRTIPLTVAMFVDYLDSPVGPYREVLASPVLHAPGRDGPAPALAVPFIAVDSEMSVHGGRTHWRLPKVPAGFSGDVHVDVAAEGDGWAVRAATRARGPRVPVIGALALAQPLDDGAVAGTARARVCLRGHARVARVVAGAEGPTLPRWLVGGPHPGVVVTDGTLTVGAARIRPVRA